MLRVRQLLPALVFTLVLSIGCTAQSPVEPSNRQVILATTSSTQDSGLLDVLIPAFQTKSGYQVKTIAVGTGQALAMAEKGEADLVLAHSPADERRLVEKGAVVNRRLVMHNDFVLVGPPEDPARVASVTTVTAALAQIEQAAAPFVSRGDDSGTHKKELALWQSAGITPSGAWYLQSGSGMGQTLRIADEKRGYTLTDRATYLASQKQLGLTILVEKAAPLLNLYHAMEVNAAKFSKVNGAGARALSDFMLSAEGQKLIAEFGRDKYGAALFVPDGGKSEENL